MVPQVAGYEELQTNEKPSKDQTAIRVSEVSNG
jgi:hypothetical protein